MYLIQKTDHIKEHICINEQKTGKERIVAINSAVYEVLTVLQADYCCHKEGQYLFPSPKHPKEPLSRSQAFRIMREAAEYAGLEEHISCHSLRKTFGYQAWKQGVPPPFLWIFTIILPTALPNAICVLNRMTGIRSI